MCQIERLLLALPHDATNKAQKQNTFLYVFSFDDVMTNEKLPTLFKDTKVSLFPCYMLHHVALEPLLIHLDEVIEW